MQGLMYEGPGQLRMMDVKDPVPAAGEALIRVTACGICGSDVHGYLGTTGRRTPPMVMGHEFVGVVDRLGPGVTRVRPGDRVAVQPLIFCGTCPACRQGLTNRCPVRSMFGVLQVNGAMAERIAVPERLIYALPSSVDDVHGSLLEPLAVAYSAVRRAGSAEAQYALVIGAGTIGLMVVQMLRSLRPGTKILVMDVNARRLLLARELGAADTLVPPGDDIKRWLAAATASEGVSLAFEVVGAAATVQQALAALEPGGTCVWVGNAARMIELNMQEVVTRELDIRGTYAYTHAAFGEALNILASGRLNLDPMISRVAPLKEGPALFEKLAQGKDNLIKAILTNDAHREEAGR